MASPSADSAATLPENPGEAPPHRQEGEPIISPHSPLLREVSVTLEARLGETTMAVADLLGLRSGALLSLDRRIDDPVDLYLNGALVARGEIVTVDNMFGVRVVEVAPK